MAELFTAEERELCVQICFLSSCF